MTEVLLVCTANRCRSPIAAAVLRQRLPAGSEVVVDSAGLMDEAAMPVPDEGIALMRRYGLNLENHRSRTITIRDLRDHDLVLGMTRGHVRDLLALEPGAFARIFTLKDFVHRIESTLSDRDLGDLGDFGDHGQLSDAMAAVNADRAVDSVLGASDLDDIRDPIGESLGVWTTVTRELVDYADRLAFALSYARPRAERTGRRTQHRR
jgi:protein-tyrosine phosphatase